MDFKAILPLLLAGNKNAAMAQLLKSAMSNEHRKNNVFGIEHIAGVANDEILGKMVKYIENNRPGAKKGRK